MDGPRFDRIARILSKPAGRRALIASLLALPAGAAAVDAARCAKAGAACSKKKRCCAGTSCRSGKCACPSGRTRCGTRCLDLSGDPANCGSCGKVCQLGESCRQGACVLVCGAGLTNCGGACIDTAISAQHCGGCQSPCGAGLVCIGGACAAPPPCNGGCAAGELCVGGACARDCRTDPTPCTITWNYGTSNAAMRVVAGSTVRWSGSVSAHPLSVNNGSVTVSAPNANLQTAAFSTAGSYPFVCTNHGTMTGTITVVAAP